MKEAVLQVRLNTSEKESAEKLYKSLGTSLPEAVRIFIKQSLIEDGFPFQPIASSNKKKSCFGILHEYANPKLRKKEKEAFNIEMEEKYG